MDPMPRLAPWSLIPSPYELAMPDMMCQEQFGRPGAVACAHYDSTHGPEMVNPDWMSYLPDDMPLSQMSIPGTHNSLSLYGTMATVTQTWDLPTQLKAGIRYLDLRVRVSQATGDMHIFNGREYQHMAVDDVLLWVVWYLRQHPGEVVLIRIRLDRENNPKNISRNKLLPKEVSRREKETVIMDLANESRRLFEGLKNLIDDGRSFAPYSLKVTDVNVLLGQARGKFIVIQDFDGPLTTLNYNDDFEVVDPYIIGSLDESAIKRRRKVITDHLKKAKTSTNKEKYFLTYTSADGRPWSTIHPFRAALEINAEVVDFLQKHMTDGIHKLGIVAMDFPGQVLVSGIIHRNFNNKRKWDNKKKKFIYE